ncbi:CRISPR-associated protein, Cmr6 family [Thermoanaerobacter uzonensis DSM 18761]|uniref:CRISPR-associated protein, Cmr6 family n=1 Tax=Thermoanaerobacter uzonensis DSM 18761 TaxID=1123369 RepID=A0A1M4Y0C6_9THEO|nr:type III-B CRISPR module RAMP protein Cmr6 [Thermoanaerobacter uzonensis]SHE99191.1 CRISPR-associated protein, Cmr6 family [Thermoanaerobacter uzonensis DSM 18761]
MTKFREKRKDERYIFYNPADTRSLLFKEIEKYSTFKWNTHTGKEEEKSFEYHSSSYVKNSALIFSKLIPYSFDGNGLVRKDNKVEYLKLVINEMNKVADEVSYISTRLESVINSFKNNGYKVKSFKGKPLWRFVVGLGASHPQETSMTLHHIYGVPYIPASAIKGIIKHWSVLKFAEEYARIKKGEDVNFDTAVEEISEKLREGKNLSITIDNVSFYDLIRIFGTQEREGEIIFFDAYPCDKITLKIDVMNPHYKNYYFSTQPPADWDQPRPLPFLTVENTKFAFYVAGKDETLTLKAVKCAKDALKEHGVGAKTSLGYGIFTDF